MFVFEHCISIQFIQIAKIKKKKNVKYHLKF